METVYTSKESKETFESAIIDFSKGRVSLKRADAKFTDLAEALKNFPLRCFIHRTTMRSVAPYAGGFKFCRIKTPAPIYLFTKGYDVNFEEKKKKKEDNIKVVRQIIAHEKTHKEVERTGYQVPRIKQANA